MPFPFIMCIINENNVQVPCKLQIASRLNICMESKFLTCLTSLRSFVVGDFVNSYAKGFSPTKTGP